MFSTIVSDVCASGHADAGRSIPACFAPPSTAINRHASCRTLPSPRARRDLASPAVCSTPRPAGERYIAHSLRCRHRLPGLRCFRPSRVVRCPARLERLLHVQMRQVILLNRQATTLPPSSQEVDPSSTASPVNAGTQQLQAPSQPASTLMHQMFPRAGYNQATGSTPQP